MQKCGVWVIYKMKTSIQFFFILSLMSLCIPAYAAPMLLPIGDMTATEGSSLRFTVVATDNSPVSYSVSNLPSGASFSPLSTQEIFDPYSSGQKFSWTPSSSQVGTYDMCFSASNGASSTKECITITVKKNYLLHPSDCPSGFIVRGDGVCTENVRRTYGADAKPTSDPLGGGVGYSAIIDPKSADFIVSTRSELLNAFQNAVSGQIIYVTDSASIDLTGDNNIAIPAGVTLASGRGRGNSLGALIYSNSPNELYLFITRGEGVRVTGLRLQGPDPDRRTEQMQWLYAQGRYYDLPNSAGVMSRYSRLTVDNCELYGWTRSVFVYTGSLDNHIHHNFMHHNQREGLGYGVDVKQGASALIEGNVFNWNRHAIDGDYDSSPGASYEACYNLVLGDTTSHYFDMHGGNDASDPTIPAGDTVKIHHNTFMESSERVVAIRGIPTTGVWVYKNWVLATPTDDYPEEYIFTQLLNKLPGHTPYEKMSVYDNWFGATPPPSGTPTPTIPTATPTPTPTIPKVTPTPTPTVKNSIGVFRSGQWILDYGMDGTTNRRLNFGSATDIPVAGDFNNDGKTDIGVFRSGQWILDYGMDGTVNRQVNYGHEGYKPVVGDFNNDGKTDIGVFRSGQWILDYGMDGNEDRRFYFGVFTDTPIVGDFNNDGKTDIGVYRSGQWILDYGMDGTVNSRFNYGLPSDKPVVGDFNNDGKTDIGVYRSGQWILDYGINGGTDRRFNYGLPTDTPIVGKWV
jgi:hypothetical protein